VIHPVRCLLCGETAEARDVPDHVRLMHPGVDAEPECWPDGTPVAFEDLDLFAETNARHP
jgi:hypothetical protein